MGKTRGFLFLLNFFPLNSQTNSVIPDMICRFVLFSFRLSLKYICNCNGFLYAICIRLLALYFYTMACQFRHLLCLERRIFQTSTSVCSLRFHNEPGFVLSRINMNCRQVLSVSPIYFTCSCDSLTLMS